MASEDKALRPDNPGLLKVWTNNEGQRGETLRLDGKLRVARAALRERARAAEDIAAMADRAARAGLPAAWSVPEMNAALAAANTADAAVDVDLNERNMLAKIDAADKAVAGLERRLTATTNTIDAEAGLVEAVLKHACNDDGFRKRLKAVLAAHKTACTTLRSGVSIAAEGLGRRQRRSNTDLGARVSAKLTQIATLTQQITDAGTTNTFGRSMYSTRTGLEAQQVKLRSEIMAEVDRQDTGAAFREALDRLRTDARTYAETVFTEVKNRLTGPENGCRQVADKDKARDALLLLLEVRMRSVLRSAAAKLGEVVEAEREFARRMTLRDRDLAAALQGIAESSLSDVDRETRTLELTLLTAHRRVADMVVRSEDRSIGLFKPSSAMVYAFKLTRIITAFVAGYATQRMFDQYFAKRLAANGTRDPDAVPPDLGWFVATYVGLQALFDAMVGAGIWFMTRIAMDNDGVLVDYAFDTAVSLVLATSSLVWISNIVQDNRYFEYRIQTPRATRLMREMCVAVTLVHTAVPYFYLVGPFASVRSIAVGRLTASRTKTAAAGSSEPAGDAGGGGADAPVAAGPSFARK